MIIKIKGGNQTTINILEFVLGTTLILGGMISILLFVKTLLNPCTERTKYLLLIGMWSVMLMFLVGFDILSLNVEGAINVPLATAMVLITLKAIIIYIAFAFYNSQKVNYDPIKA